LCGQASSGGDANKVSGTGAANRPHFPAPIGGVIEFLDAGKTCRQFGETALLVFFLLLRWP
jgi:hypothetical protein